MAYGRCARLRLASGAPARAGGQGRLQCICLSIVLAALVAPLVRAQTACEGGSVEIQDQQAFSIVGIAVRTHNRAEMEGAGKIGPLWRDFMARNQAAHIPDRADDKLLAIYSEYANGQNGDYTYILGARVTTTAHTPPGFTAMTIPAGRYAVFLSDRGPTEQVVPAVWRRIWAASLAQLGGERAFRADYEVYPRDIDRRNALVTVHVGLK